MTTIHDLTSLSAALSLPVHRPATRQPWPCIVFRGPLMAFHHRLEECGVAHEVGIDDVSGMFVKIPGFVIERGELGGVMVRESATVLLGQGYPVGGPPTDEHGRAILFGETGEDTDRVLRITGSAGRLAEVRRSDYVEP